MEYGIPRQHPQQNYRPRRNRLVQGSLALPHHTMMTLRQAQHDVNMWNAPENGNSGFHIASRHHPATAVPPGVEAHSDINEYMEAALGVPAFARIRAHIFEYKPAWVCHWEPDDTHGGAVHWPKLPARVKPRTVPPSAENDEALSHLSSRPFASQCSSFPTERGALLGRCLLLYGFARASEATSLTMSAFSQHISTK